MSAQLVFRLSISTLAPPPGVGPEAGRAGLGGSFRRSLFSYHREVVSKCATPKKQTTPKNPANIATAAAVVAQGRGEAFTWVPFAQR